MKVRACVGVVLTAVAIAVAGCGDDDDAAPTATAPIVTPASTAAAEAITIDTLAGGERVSTPIDLGGTANTFEAALTVDVIDTAGDTLCVRNIMASSGSGTPGTWATTLAVPPADADTAVTVRAYELSAMDGSMINVVERDVTLSTERPPLFITSPACGAAFAPGDTLVVEGMGVVFEAAFNLELRDASGTAVATAMGMAGGTEELAFSLPIAIPADTPSAMYDLVAFSYSAEDGSVQNEFSVQVIVQ